MKTLSELKDFYSTELLTTKSRVSVIDIHKEVEGLSYSLFELLVNKYIAENRYHDTQATLDGIYTLAYYPKGDGLVASPYKESHDIADHPQVGVAKVNFQRNSHYVNPYRTIEEWFEHADYLTSLHRSLRAFSPNKLDLEAIKNRPPMLLMDSKEIPNPKKITFL